jgi:mannose/fructose/N-acetylgalactosamine-specific phosphotransferase system component IIC
VIVDPPAGWLAPSLLGAVLGLDVVSFPQAMLFRPIVAATLAGTLAGSPSAGLMVGATLELVALETLPIGASRYPEWGSAAVVGGTLYAVSDGPELVVRAGAMCVAVVAAIAASWIAGRSMVALRQMNGWLARRNIEALAAGSASTVVRLQMTGLVADFVRGFFMTAVALLILLPLQTEVLARWHSGPRVSRAIVVGFAAMVAGGAVWRLVHAVPRARWLFLGGLAVGLAVLGLST